MISSSIGGAALDPVAAASCNRLSRCPSRYTVAAQPPVPGAPPAPEPGLSRDSFVCAYAPRDGARPERPACEHYGAIVMPSRGITKGMRASPREIRRFCRALAIGSQLFELTDNDVLACTLRHPMDPESERKILEVEREQRENAADAARRAGKIDI